MDAKRLSEIADDLFSKKFPLNSLWQEIGDNLYPERADFTMHRPLGSDFAAVTMTSYPIMCRRDLGNSFSTMLRPVARPWFHVGRKYQESEDTETKQILQHFETVQRRAMYDPGALFTRATKEGDHDFAGFGQCVISAELNKRRDGLLYRAWHLRDCAWQENEEGQIGFFARKWKASANTLVRTFEGKGPIHEKILTAASKTPFEEFEYLHIVCDAEMYDDNARNRPRWSIWWDKSHGQLVEAVPIWGRHYIVPRWQTVSSSQYAYSPATVCALPDARLIQAMTYTLLEAGEKATSPPMIATKDTIRSDVALYAGGITWVDNEYDERLGDALRPISQDFRGFNFGLEMNRDTRAMIHKAFFLDALTLPQRAPEMTAYEVSQRVQEYIRNALPIFEPMEMEYNAALCDETFELLWRNGAFGDPRSWPKTLRGAEIEFNFESPLHDAIEQQKGQIYTEGNKLVAEAVSLDPSAKFVPKAEVALRDALMGIGVPAKWLNSEADVEAMKKQQQQQEAAQQTLAAMEQGSNVAKNLGQSGMMNDVVGQ